MVALKQSSRKEVIAMWKNEWKKEWKKYDKDDEELYDDEISLRESAFLKGYDDDYIKDYWDEDEF